MSDLKMSARFSQDRRYRWTLTREWGTGTFCAFIGLNPSTADETKNDPTITRCISHARSWGHENFLMLNLYAFRATDPREMWAARKRGVDIIGQENYFDDLGCIAAWGIGGGDRGKNFGKFAIDAGVKLDCLMKTRDGHPQHPLYLPGGLMPEPWNYSEGK